MVHPRSAPGRRLRRLDDRRPHKLGQRAERRPGGADSGAAAQGTKPSGGIDFMLIVFLMLGAMILIMSFSGRKDKKKRAQMLSSLGRRDKIQTAGGIIGTVVELKDNEVLIETDRASHTRLWLARGSISSVIKQSKSHETSEEEDTSAANA